MEQEVNQQERPELAWLTGILEGEGSLYFSRRVQSNRGYDIYPRCNIYNTDPAIIDGVCDVLKKHEVGYHIQGHRLNGKLHGLYVHVNGIKRQQKLLTLLLPHMRSKKKIIAVKLLHYFNWRLQQPFHHFDKEIGRLLDKEITELNNSGILRDYTPNHIRVEDIVRPA
jgi:hypothetical protein